MSRVRVLITPDPVIPRVMSRLLRAIDAHGRCCEPAVLSLRSAALVRTFRRWLMATKGANVHSDLRLAAALSDFERHWDSAAVIARDFESYQRDSRNLMGMINQRVSDRLRARPARPALDPSPGCRAPRPLRRRVPG